MIKIIVFIPSKNCFTFCERVWAELLEASLATLEASLVILEAWQPWLTLKCKCRYYVLFVLIIDIQCNIAVTVEETRKIDFGLRFMFFLYCPRSLEEIIHSSYVYMIKYCFLCSVEFAEK